MRIVVPDAALAGFVKETEEGLGVTGAAERAAGSRVGISTSLARRNH
jgi:hypothetical protein